MSGVPGGTPGDGPTGGGPPIDLCNSPACIGAKAKVDAARASFTKDCNALRYIKNWLDILKPIVTTSIWWIVVLIIIATILWLIGLGFLSIILWIILLLYVISWFVYLALGRSAASLAQALETDMQAFIDAVAATVAACPDHCRGDLTPPTCDVSYP